MRFITFSRFDEHSTPLFKLLNIKLCDLIQLLISIFMYKFHYKFLPSYFNTFFTEIGNFHNYSAQNGSESRFRDKCFFFLVSTCVTYYGLFYRIIWFVLRHCLRIIAPLELYCASVSQYYLSFKLSGRLYFFTFFAICPFISSLLLHSFSNYIVALRDDR